MLMSEVETQESSELPIASSKAENTIFSTSMAN